MKLDANYPLFEHHLYKGVRVFCEGEEIIDCVVADDGADNEGIGHVELFYRDKWGRLELDPNGNGGFLRGRRMGQVCIIFPMGPPTKELALYDWLNSLA